MNNILIAGVGGQGIVLASKLIAFAASENGMDVMGAETIGMAQKGGSVTGFLRTASAEKGEKLYCPMFPKGKGDIIIAFEPSEAVRNISCLKKGGTVIVNTNPVMPVTAALMGGSYSGSEMTDYLRELEKGSYIKLFAEDMAARCRELGNPRVLNILMLGLTVKSGAIDGITAEDIKNAIRKNVKPQFVDMNIGALESICS